MVETVVTNTGPLVAFSRVDLLDAMGQLPYKFICPEEVSEELSRGQAFGHRPVRPEWLKTEALSSPIDHVALLALDMGEAAVIQLALEKGVRRVCIDERKGRLAAHWVGLEVIGSLGLLIRAKKLGLIAALSPVIEKLKQAGVFYNENLIQQVLESVGE